MESVGQLLRAKTWSAKKAAIAAVARKRERILTLCLWKAGFAGPGGGEREKGVDQVGKEIENEWLAVGLSGVVGSYLRTVAHALQVLPALYTHFRHRSYRYTQLFI